MYISGDVLLSLENRGKKIQLYERKAKFFIKKRKRLNLFFDQPMKDVEFIRRELVNKEVNS